MIIKRQLAISVVFIVITTLTSLKTLAQEKPNNIIEQTNKVLKLDKKSPLYLYNDKIVSKRLIEKISKENIDSISVVEPEKALKEYGVNGKNGVVKIYGRKRLGLIENKHVSEIGMMSVKDFLISNAYKDDVPDYNKALIIVNNKQKDKTILDSITMPNLASIAFETGKEIEVQKKYGKESVKNGVIIVKTIDREAVYKKYHEFLLKNKEMIFVIDGIPSTINVARNLNPLNIKSVDILKGAAATAVYGNRGENGVILISLKNPKKN